MMRPCIVQKTERMPTTQTIAQRQWPSQGRLVRRTQVGAMRRPKKLARL